jgi:hypothetical protein
MSNTKHTGGCHCGAVRFEVDTDLGKGVSRCNCTVCTKRGATGQIVKPDAFRLTQGENDLGVYTWGSGVSGYRFCKRCGINVYGSGTLDVLGGDFVSVNVNCLDGIDPNQLQTIHWDGRHDNWQAGPRDKPWPVNA